MGVTGLHAAIARGEPLVDVTVRFRDSVDASALTDLINDQCEDFDLCPRPWYDHPQLRVGTGTRAAVERLFGLRVERVRLERYDEVTGTWGHWPDVWRWKQAGDPDLSQSALGTLVDSVALSAPGSDDEGQPWE